MEEAFSSSAGEVNLLPRPRLRLGIDHNDKMRSLVLEPCRNIQNRIILKFGLFY